jgi:integrase/recombinase XerD
MKDSPEKISPLRRRMIEDMRMRKLSTKTQSTYIRAVRHFAGYLGRSPDTATDEDLRRYQLHCVDRGVSPMALNAMITGLRFFFDVTLKRPELMSKMSHIVAPCACRGQGPSGWLLVSGPGSVGFHEHPAAQPRCA